MKVTLVCAGSHQEFRGWLMDNGFSERTPEHQYRYVNGPESCFAMMATAVEVVGRFWDRDDAQQLYEAAMRSLAKGTVKARG